MQQQVTITRESASLFIMSSYSPLVGSCLFKEGKILQFHIQHMHVCSFIIISWSRNLSVRAIFVSCGLLEESILKVGTLSIFAILSTKSSLLDHSREKKSANMHHGMAHPSSHWWKLSHTPCVGTHSGTDIRY